MNKEIERKYLVRGDGWRGKAEGVDYRQGYIPTSEHVTVRVRVAGDKGYLTIKGKRSGISRSEYEFEIPVETAEQMLSELCGGKIVEKRRYVLDHKGRKWEVDEFVGDNDGLITAEVELDDENAPVELPDWVGQEVSNDVKYYNFQLTQRPYKTWVIEGRQGQIRAAGSEKKGDIDKKK